MEAHLVGYHQSFRIRCARHGAVAYGLPANEYQQQKHALDTMKRTAFLRRLIYGKPVPLKPYERICLDGVIDALSSRNATKLRSQLELLRFRYRQTEDRVLLFLPESDEQVPSDVLFADRSDELLVARMVVAQNGKHLNAKLLFHKGRLAALQFNRSPPTAEFTASEPFGIQSFTLVNDPDLPRPAAKREVFPSN